MHSIKIRIEKFIVLVFLIGYVSTYIAVAPIYIAIFFIFSILVSIYFFLVPKGNLKKYTVPYFSLIVGFIINALFIYFINRPTSSLLVLIKLISNFLYLLSSIVLFSHIDLCNYQKLFKKTFVLIISISFIQVVLNVALVGLWSVPFNQENSIASFAITNPGVIFGVAQKNIWATKFVMTTICFCYGWFFGVFNVTKTQKILLLSMIAVGVIYLMSRTAQMIFLLFIFSLMWYKYVKNTKMLYKILGFVCIVGISVYVFPIIFEKVLRLDSNMFDVSKGHEGDGFKARVILWYYLFNHISDVNLYFGNGILFVDSFFEGVFDESNIHNTYINVWLDLGVSGIVFFMVLSVKAIYTKVKGANVFWILGLPFFSCLLVQYIGYDNDIIMYLAMAMFYKFILSTDSRFTKNKYV